MPGIDTWHVMISSTMSDLVDERNTVASAIAEAGMQVWRAEQPPARLLGLTPERFCQRMAEECDLYVLIVGARYGYIPTEQSPLNDLSITHLEYRWARSANRRKVLVYLTDDSLHTSDERQKQFVEEVQDFHLGYLRPQPFASLPYLHDQLAEALKEWQSAQNRGMLKYLNYVIDTYGSFDDPVTKKKAPIQTTVPVLIRALDAEPLSPDDWQATSTSKPGIAAINLVAQVLEDFAGGREDLDELQTFRHAVQAHEDLISQSMDSLVSESATLLRSGLLKALFFHPLAGKGTCDDDDANFTDLIEEGLARRLSHKPRVVDTAQQLLYEFPHLLLVGDPGTGKSILVRQLAHTLALQALETPDLFQASIPLCINAQQLSEVLEAKASLV